MRFSFHKYFTIFFFFFFLQLLYFIIFSTLFFTQDIYPHPHPRPTPTTHDLHPRPTTFSYTPAKPQTNYFCFLQFSYLAPYWLISRNTITFHKYFWCSRFCEFHRNRLLKIKQIQACATKVNVQTVNSQKETKDAQLGTSRSHDYDGNENVKTTIGLIS